MITTETLSITVPAHWHYAGDMCVAHDPAHSLRKRSNATCSFDAATFTSQHTRNDDLDLQLRELTSSVFHFPSPRAC